MKLFYRDRIGTSNCYNTVGSTKVFGNPPPNLYYSRASFTREKLRLYEGESTIAIFIWLQRTITDFLSIIDSDHTSVTQRPLPSRNGFIPHTVLRRSPCERIASHTNSAPILITTYPILLPFRYTRYSSVRRERNLYLWINNGTLHILA